MKSELLASSKKTSMGSGMILMGIIAGVIVIPMVTFRLMAPSKDSYTFYGSKQQDSSPAFDFRLTDQDGNPFQLSSLKGKVVLLNFGFTHCANICPTTLGNLAAAYRNLSPTLQNEVKVVFVSIDPPRDTPKVLKDYVPFFNRDFIGLTGSAEEIAQTAKAYGVFYQRSPADKTKSIKPTKSGVQDYSMDHSPYTYLIDPEGRLAVLYRFEQMNDTKKISQDIEHILSL